MNLVDRHLAFVKDQIFLQEKLANRYRDVEWRANKHAENAENMRAILSDLEMAQNFINAHAQDNEIVLSLVSSGIAMTPEDLEGLPPELLSELSLSETDKLEFEILEIIRNAGGVLPLNKILIGLYRKTHVVHKRPALNSRLYRMVQRGRLHNVPELRGVYSLAPITADEAKGLFGNDPGQDDAEDYRTLADFTQS